MTAERSVSSAHDNSRTIVQAAALAVAGPG
jgi:hypothetical protein